MSDVVNNADGQQSDSATLSFPGGTAEFPIRPAIDGASSIDLSTLTRKTGLTGLDYGFVNTASTESKITYIDGEQGILRYRGYPIEQLAEHSTYLEVAYLLLYGDLPNESQLKTWSYEVTHHTFIHENMRKRFVDGFHYDAHPMGMFISALGALGTFYNDAKNIFDAESRHKQILRLIASPTPGYCTFNAARRPSRRTTRWT